jgi:hypothetical protein
MRFRQHLLPLVLTVVGVVGAVAGATVSTGGAVPALVLEQSGHWVLNRAASTVVHVHGGTRQVDAQVALPADAARDGVVAVAGDTEGYVVGRDRMWTFDRSTLTVIASAPTPAAEVPVPVDVAGGPYLVYRQAGTVVRLGRPAVVLHVGGPLGPPVHTADGTVWVHRPDSGAVCALRREAVELDCSTSVAPGTPGGLSVTAAAATFVDTVADTGRRVRGAAFDAGAALGADLPDDTLLGDQQAGPRLPVVAPGQGLLRLLDVAGLPDLHPGGPPIDVGLGPGSFSPPLVSGSVVVVLELTTSRLLTFTADGVKVAEVALPPGTGADALQQGADGRIYVDEPGGGRTHVVQPDGTVVAVDLGPGTAPGAAVAPPEAQRRGVVPPPVGQVPVPDVRAAPGPGVVPPAQPGGLPGQLLPQPPIPQPPIPQPPDPLPPGPGDPNPPVVPAGPTGVRAVLTGADGATVTWNPVDGGGLPVTYTVSRGTDAQTIASTQPTATFAGLTPATYRFTVTAATAAGTSPASAPSNAVTVAAPAPEPPTGLAAQRHNISGTLDVMVDWTAPAAGPVPVTGYQVTRAGKLASGTSTTTKPHFDDFDNFCSPTVTYEVRSTTADGTTSAPATFTLDSPVDCTVPTEVTSAVAEADGSVTVTVDCTTASHSPWDTTQPIQVLFDGVRRNTDSQTCARKSQEHDFHTFAIAGLQPGTTYAVASRTTSSTGTKTSAALAVTTA